MGFFKGVGSAITGGLLGIGGSLISNKQGESASARQMDFQEQMSRTAHQREVEDLRKAGLNPVLSAGGRGASTPGGSMPNIADLGKAATGGVNSATMRMQAEASARNTKAIADQSEAQGKIWQDVLAAYNAHPTIRKSIVSAYISSLIGVPKPVGAASSALKKFMQYMNPVQQVRDWKKVFRERKFNKEAQKESNELLDLYKNSWKEKIMDPSDIVEFNRKFDRRNPR